jgi:hypothetical protein
MRNEDAIIYLCGSINGRSDEDCVKWRKFVTTAWPGVCLDPMRRDYRFVTITADVAREVVAADLADIHACHGVLVFFDKPSVGTSMEVFYAKHVLRKPVVMVDLHGSGRWNPWFTHHTDAIYDNFQSALRHLLHAVTRVNGSH